jgi:polysaccharide export outer membrane protein
MSARSLVAWSVSLVVSAVVLGIVVRAAEPPPAAGQERSSPPGETPPRELAMRPLPDYRIEPPDIIAIEMLKLVPRPPYRAEIFDVLQIRAYTPPDFPPIDNYFMVQAEGKIDLGPPYGAVKVQGMTLDEIAAALNKWLRQWLVSPTPYVQLARVSGAQPVTGQYLVAPDGTINLRQYGKVLVMGKTVAEARRTIQEHLTQFLEGPDLSVDVAAYNSKVYYVVTQGGVAGDGVRRLPVTGNETVLDAISQINGLSALSSKKIWIARPSAADGEQGTILPVDYGAITSRGATATNYQLFPGDRLFIADKPAENKKAAP